MIPKRNKFLEQQKFWPMSAGAQGVKFGPDAGWWNHKFTLHPIIQVLQASFPYCTVLIDL